MRAELEGDYVDYRAWDTWVDVWRESAGLCGVDPSAGDHGRGAAHRTRGEVGAGFEKGVGGDQVYVSDD